MEEISNNKKFVCSVGIYTNTNITPTDEEDIELSSYRGNAIGVETPNCPTCSKKMKTMLHLHCPTDDHPTRHVSIFYCSDHSQFKAISSIIHQKELIQSNTVNSSITSLNNNINNSNNNTNMFSLNFNTPSSNQQMSFGNEFSFGTSSNSMISNNSTNSFNSMNSTNQINSSSTEGGFGLMDLDMTTLASMVTTSAPKKETKKKVTKSAFLGRWIEWYEEYKTVKEFDIKELSKIEEYKTDEINEEDEFESVDDKQWEKYIKSMNENPKQIVRYGGDPLLITDENCGKENVKMCCTKCGEEVLYEMQVLSSIISVMKDVPEFGSLLIFGCENCVDNVECHIVVLDPID